MLLTTMNYTMFIDPPLFPSSLSILTTMDFEEKLYLERTVNCNSSINSSFNYKKKEGKK